MKRLFLLPLLLFSIFTLAARQPEKGYRGFIEWSNDLRRPHYFYGRENDFYTGISSSHGYQFNENLFFGAVSPLKII